MKLPLFNQNTADMREGRDNKCPRCGNKLKKNDRFCPKCGQDTTNNAQREEYQGKIKKCPSCGGIIEGIQVSCPYCGHEFTDAATSNAVKEFSDKLQELESGRPPLGVFKTLKKSMGLRVKNDKDEEIISHITNFTIPNTKEDIMEFMILASTNIKALITGASWFNLNANHEEEKFNHSKLMAWIAKMEQALQKAVLSFGSDPSLANVQQIYDSTMGQYKKSPARVAPDTRRFILIGILFGILLLLCVGLPLLMAGLGY